MNERSFIVKSYFAIHHIFSCFRESSRSQILVKRNHPAVTHVAEASDRGEPRSKYVAAVYFKISYPVLSPQRDAKRPA
jgi:hypothetical protein